MHTLIQNGEVAEYSYLVAGAQSNNLRIIFTTQPE